MITATEEFKNIFADGTEPLYEELDITFSDGTKKTFFDEISPDGSEFSDGAGSSSFPIGATVCKTLTFDLDNTDGELDEKKFYGARIIAYLTFLSEEGTKARIKKGSFTVTDSKGYDEVISVTAMDDMAKTNQLYISGLVLPQTADAIISDICTTLGISKGFSNLKHGSFVISEIPDKVTYRQMIGYVAAINCANARIDVDGYLQMIEWDFSDTDNVRTLIDFEDSPTFSQDDISITGIRVKNGEIDHLYGSSGYVIEIENGLVDEQSIQTVAAWIGDAIIGIPFRSMDGSLIHDPLIEFGDIVKSEDRKGTSYLTPITDVTYVHFGATEIKTVAQDPESTTAKYESNSSKTYNEAKKYIKQQVSVVNKNIEKLGEAIANSSGMYSTQEKQTDGSTITYYHDKPALEESTNVLKFTSEAIGISNDGGKTYPYGIVLDGTFIANQLYSVGINADYITAGNFQIVDESGKVLFSADKDLKRVYFDASNVFIGENSITKRIEDLQNQTDGNIQTWTSSPEPTLDNYPANQWLTDDERSKHVGDIYYDSNNQAYRFRYDSEGYNWQMLKDTDVTKALQDAEAAKKQAENAEKAAALAKNVTLQLSNDYATVSVDSEGNYDKFPDISIKPIVMYGSSNITTECIYNVLKSDSVSGSWNSNTLTYTLTGLSANSGWVDIRATYLGTLSVTKRFNISKLYAGEKGEKGDTSTSVFLSASNTVVRKMARNVLMPSTITFTSYYLDGSNAQKPYDVIFSIEESENGEVWKEVYRSTSAESIVNHCLYTILSGKDNITLRDADEGTIIATARQISAIRCSIYTTGNELIDTQNISVVTDATALTQQEIVEILSDDGYWKGLYYLNGRLYISFDAALGGALTLGGENNGNGLLKIRDEEGNDIGYIDNTGVHFNQGEFSGKVHASQIDGSKVTGSTFLSDNRKTATKVEAGTVRLRNTELDENAYVENEDTGEMMYVGAEDADWSSESDIANAGYMQTSSRYYPDIANSEVTVEENVAAMELNAFWGLFIRAEKSDIASFGKNLVKLFGRTEIQGDTNITGDVEVLNGNGQVHCNTLWTKYLQVDSTKSRLVDTQNYQEQYLHAFETPTPMFGDCGSGQLNGSGEDLVPIDDILLEAINSGIEYQVFLQKEGSGDIWVESKTSLYFAVKGTPKLKYSWEIKAVQRDYEHIRWDDMTVIALDTDLVEYDTCMSNLQEEELEDMDEIERLLLTETERSGLKLKQ